MMAVIQYACISLDAVDRIVINKRIKEQVVNWMQTAEQRTC